jgi:hypothetical protein
MRMTILAIALVLCAFATLVISGCGGGSSSPGVGSIQGYVFGQITAVAGKAAVMTLGRGPTPPDGYEALVGAVVMVTGSSTIATTDAQGHFQIDNVIAGPQTVTASKSGYLTAVVPVTVVVGQVVTVTDALLTPSVRTWTILVYLNADNNLEEFGIEDVNEMEMVGSSPEVDILVQMDRSPYYDTSNGDWIGARRMRIIHDADTAIINSPVLENLGSNVDMGDWHVLHDFIVWGQTNYPAEHYMVVIWNHGAGWRAAAAGTPEANPATRGVSFDDTSGTHIATTDLPRALDVQPRMDLITFDASLMQMVEVAYQVRHYGRIMVGSEESPPGSGYAYQTFLGPLVATPTMLPEQLASEIVTQTLAYYNSIGFTGALTQSAVALDRMDNLALAVDGFARALATAMPAYSAQITSARTQAQRYAYPDNKDLYDFALLISQLVPQDNVVQAAQAVTAAVDDAVIAEDHNLPARNSHGLAIFVPKSGDYITFYRASYRTLEFSMNTAWDEWLSVSPP